MEANVFNIERYATEDGHGIRTVVFLKGCGLRCRWCANPESQQYRPENLLNVNTCIGCGKCESICPNRAIRYMEGYGYIADQAKCHACRHCIDHCYIDARKIMGTYYTEEELLAEILKDEQYYRRSGGGVTFSGGEPFFYSKMIVGIAAKMKKRSLTTLVETCGYVPQRHIKEAAGTVDYIYYDIKHIDPQKHQELTGKDNQLILNNLDWLTRNFSGQLAVRYPYIPGCNDSKDVIKSFFQFIKDKPNISEIIFLPYHRLGLPKYKGLGRKYEMGERVSLKKNQLNHLHEWAREYDLKIKIQ